MLASEKSMKILKKQFDDTEEANKFAGTYILKRWKWGQKNKAVAKATKIDLITGISTIDSGEYQLETLAQCLLSAPFDHKPKDPNYDMLNDLPAWLGDLLISEARIINRELTTVRQKNLSALPAKRKVVTQ